MQVAHFKFYSLLFVFISPGLINTSDLAWASLPDTPYCPNSTFKTLLGLSGPERTEFLHTIASTVCFVHVPKTGGSNFKNLPLAEHLFSSDASAWWSGKLNFKMCGHVDSPPCLGGRELSIAFLRDPRERVISAFQHTMSIAQICTYPSVENNTTVDFEHVCACCGVKMYGRQIELFRSGKYSLAAFLENRDMVDNQMTKMLCGTYAVEYCKEYPSSCRSLLRRLIDRHFLFIGLAERYEESLNRIADLLVVENADLSKAKQVVWVNRTKIEIDSSDFTPPTPRFPSLDASTKHLLSNHVEVDMVLFKVVKSLYAWD